MTDSAAVRSFIAKWEQNTQKESAAAKEHFAELCRLVGVPTPNDPGSGPDTYCFERSLTKTGGKAGFADVWKRDCFAWEYKGKRKYANLDAAYSQLLLYKEDLGNPPVLVVSDIANYEVHIAFTGYRTRIERFANADLANASTRELLRQVFTNPEPLRPVERQETITEQAAARLADVARLLEKRYAPAEIAHFFMKVLFALFAEDIHLLPAELMSQSIKQAIFKPAEFVGRTRALFRAMKTGDYFGMERVPQFNGWLFDDDAALALTADELQFLADAARLDWSQVEPAIFGTLFERSLDPSKRAQLGVHYTSRSDILLIVEPVLMQPLRRDWAEVQTGVEALRGQWEPLAGNARRKLISVAEGMLLDFAERLAQVRILDPACGSGNFLYVALTELKNLEKEIWTYASGVGVPQPQLSVSPAQLFGIEKNQFAAELAQVVVWIGYLQWKRANGFFDVEEPILQTLHNIECRDAILTVDLHGQPAEPEWPAADVIVGNPPFLGGKRLRTELGHEYVEAIFQLYAGQVAREADLVTYWFERARALIADEKVTRAGLLATNSIRGGANRKVLERIKQTGDIFMAWSDLPWILDGAAVHVSMIGFDKGAETGRVLDGKLVTNINSDLSGAFDLTSAKRLFENVNIAYMGDTKGGPFDISEALAKEMLDTTINPNSRPNSDVMLPWVNGLDISRQPRRMWIIDFGVDMSESEAAQYILPFAYAEREVKPVRLKSRTTRPEWWLHERPRPEMRSAIKPLTRYIGSPSTAKHRLYAWLQHPTLPDHALFVFAREDDYFLGVLHSRPHELWALRLGTSLEDRPRYTPTSTFDTFPFPWPPGKEPQGDACVEAIAEAARELVRMRDEWLGGALTPQPPLPRRERGSRGSDGGEGSRGDEDTSSQSPVPDPQSHVPSLKDRTLTNLYNKRPDWLAEAHRNLDAAVFDAYGWPQALSDDEILARLLALNLERAGGQGGVAARVEEIEEPDE
jgi:hypothetical protein